jgi:hypothetical protein
MPGSVRRNLSALLRKLFHATFLYQSPQSRSGESRCFAFNVGPLFLRKASFALTVELLPITPVGRQPFNLPRSFPPLQPFHNLGFR